MSEPAPRARKVSRPHPIRRGIGRAASAAAGAAIGAAVGGRTGAAVGLAIGTIVSEVAGKRARSKSTFPVAQGQFVSPGKIVPDEKPS